MKKVVKAGFAAAWMFSGTVQAETILWYRFDGEGATVVNKANPGTMDGTLRSIDTWGSKSGLGDESSKFPARVDAFPSGTRLIDPASDTVYDDAVGALSFSGNAANSGVVFLDKSKTTDTFKKMTSFTCEVFFKLPTDSTAIEARRSKDILFPLVEWASPDNGDLGWLFALRKDSSTSGFIPFWRYRYNNGSRSVSDDFQEYDRPIYDGNWHHLAIVLTADASTGTATCSFVLDYTTLPVRATLKDFSGFHIGNNGEFSLLVGADLWRSSKNCCFMGEIAEVRVSDVALSEGELLRPLPTGPVDDDTLIYLPMGDCDWFGAANTSAYVNRYHGILNAAETAVMTPYWSLVSSSIGVPYPVVAEDAIGNAVRGGCRSETAFADTKSVTFSRVLSGSEYKGHVIQIPYEKAGLADDSFTVEWFFKTDGTVSSGNSVNSYTFLNCSFAKILINQANGLLLTRPISSTGYADYNSSGRVDDAKWHHYAFVYDKDQQAISAYLDYTRIFGQTYTLTESVEKPFYFGGQTPSVQVFSGRLDDFRITKRALRADEFLTTHACVSGPSLFAHFDEDLSAGQNPVFAPDGIGGQVTGGSVPSYAGHVLHIDSDGDGQKDYSSSHALSLDGGSVVWSGNSLLACRNFTVEWFAKYDELVSPTMLLRLGMQSATGEGTISWALYCVGTAFLRLGVHVSADGSWKDIYRMDQDPDFIEDKNVTDGKWHHWALVAETNAEATPANTTFTLYKDYVRHGRTLVFANENNAGGILAFPTTGMTLSIGTGSKLKGCIDELRFTPGVLAPEAFMRSVPGGLVISLR